MKLKEKVAIITGASRGIGFAIAEAFLQEGARIALCGSKPASAQKAADKLSLQYPQRELLPLGVDLTDSASLRKMVEKTVDRWGRLDILVNNAGITTKQSILEMTDEDFDSVLRIDLAAPFKCTREAARVMKAQGSGCIINTSSMVSLYGSKMQTAYASAKAGINGLTKSCAKELGPYGIRVNAVAPGVVGTDMVAESVDPSTLAGLKSITPLGRMAEPRELAGAYVYLASEAASFTTGAILQVDGGIVM